MAKKKEECEQPELEQEAQEVTEETSVETDLPKTEPQPELAAQLKEEQDRNLRLMAEFDNYRRRTVREKETIYPDAVADTVKELLPMLDNLQRALEAPCTDEEYHKGVQMTYNGFKETLGKLGLCEFGEAGDAFDPTLHNAVMHIESEELGSNVVAQVFQRGYKIGDRVLRYAMVQQAN